MPIARVEPLTTTRRLSGPFDYRVEDGEVEVGSIVRIPFGHQKLDGVVVGLAETTEVPDEKLVSPTAVRADASRATSSTSRCGWRRSTARRRRGRSRSSRRRRGARRRRCGRSARAQDGRLTDRQRALLERLPGPAGGDLPALRRLEARGLVTIAPRASRRAPRTNPAPDRAVEPTAAQADALAAIEAAPGAAHLLHGVTGSGKTEVYLRAAAAALARGEGVIALVPEIALTPQTVARFSARFGDTVALLHSALSEGERYDEWRRLRTRRGADRRRPALRRLRAGRAARAGRRRRGARRVLQAGGRPALRRPPRRRLPRLPVRRAAARRLRDAAPGDRPHACAGCGCPRASPAAATCRPCACSTCATPTTRCTPRRAARSATAGKSIVLLNRRGWSNFLTCRSCGKAWECPNCDVALVLHRAEHAISCHHCGHRERVPDRCDACGSLSVARHGAGTERVEAELRSALDVPVFRLDADTAATKDAVPALLARFVAAPTGLLLGTQMVAKGHDFPDVTLGVVLDADSTLRFPDFRAEERTFALIAQLAGRAGRGPRGGRVLVQTTAPTAPSIEAAARHDADGFLAGELERRRALRYPPFADLIRVVCSAVEAAPARAAAARVAEEIAVPDTELLGPAPLFRLRGRERYQLVLKTGARAAAIAATGAAVEAAARDRAFRDVNFSVDVDPV